jgi:four helix bundle protein
MPDRFIPPHGGYEDLLSFQKARIVYDGTVWFCKRYLERRDRTNDQMVQAARSGKRNILEGSQASGTSKATEIKLINVARASLEELLEDYRDFLRVRGLALWPKDSREATFVRNLGARRDVSYESYRIYSLPQLSYVNCFHRSCMRRVFMHADQCRIGKGWRLQMQHGQRFVKFGSQALQSYPTCAPQGFVTLFNSPARL